MRLDISRGAIVQVEGRLFKITDDSIAFGQVEARDIEFGRIERLSVAAIKLPEEEVASIAPALSSLDSAEIEEARRRLNVIAPLLKLPRLRGSDIQRAMHELGVSKTTLYRWMNKFANDGRLTSLCPTRRPGGRGKSRLAPDVEQIIQSVIADYHLQPIQPVAKSTVREVMRRFRNADLPSPHENTVRARLRAIPEKMALKRRGHSKQAHDRYTPRPGHFEDATHPLALVQIDHTPLDLVLVDERFRIPLHRPYLTLVFDVFSRMILSFYVSFERPGALATGLAIARAILPKDDWLLKHGIEGQWPCWGFPAKIHVDNAKEFRGEMLRLACEQYGIGIDFRPERAETRFIRSVVKQGQYVVDAGANIGYHALHLASLVGPGGRVDAFEPLLYLADALRESIAENAFAGQISVHRMALDRTSGELMMRHAPRTANFGGAHFAPSGERPAAHIDELVKVTTLDESLSERCDFIKLDVEGAEPRIIQGAARILAQARPVILSELHEKQLRLVSGIGADDYIMQMASVGYRC